MTKYVLGVDPGLSGAIAVIAARLEAGEKRLELVGLWDSAYLMHPTKPGKKVTDAVKWVANLHEAVYLETQGMMGAQRIDRNEVCRLAVLEKVHASPKMGASSAFNFGAGFGLIQGALLAYSAPIRLVDPSVWKIHLGLMGKNKDDSRFLAQITFPGKEYLFKRKCDDGRAEAALLAVWGAQWGAP